MVLKVKELTDEELQRKIDELRATAPERISKTKKRAGRKVKTASQDAVQEALAKLLEETK